MKKFYEDEIYIAMCEKAIPYLGQELEDGQRFLLLNGTYSIGEPCEGGREWVKGEAAIYSEEDFLSEERKYVPIWAQDQLQEMYAPKGSLQYLGSVFYEGEKVMRELSEEIVDQITCVESIILMIIMKYKFSKTWDGEDWT